MVFMPNFPPMLGGRATALRRQAGEDWVHDMPVAWLTQETVELGHTLSGGSKTCVVICNAPVFDRPLSAA